MIWNCYYNYIKVSNVLPKTLYLKAENWKLIDTQHITQFFVKGKH